MRNRELLPGGCPKRQEANMSGLERMLFLDELAHSTAGLVEKNLAGLNQEVQNRVFLQRR
jgi:hypothetical protein